VQSAGISDANTAEAAPKKKAQSADSATTMVDILDKPRPQYTAEGRRMRTEGDVALDLVFLANGTVQVNSVISGLGHGLDEAAVRAAQQIKFKPAKRDGQPVDFPARVRIESRARVVDVVVIRVRFPRVPAGSVRQGACRGGAAPIRPFPRLPAPPRRPRTAGSDDPA